jgi:hypothetical protein
VGFEGIKFYGYDFLFTQRKWSGVNSSRGQSGIASNSAVVSAGNGLIISIDEQVLIHVTTRNTSANGGNDVSPKGTPVAKHKCGSNGAGRVQRCARKGAASEGGDDEAQAEGDGGGSLELRFLFTDRFVIVDGKENKHKSEGHDELPEHGGCNVALNEAERERDKRAAR